MHACEDGLVIRAHPHVNHLSAAEAPIDNSDSRVARFRRQINTDRSHSRNIPGSEAVRPCVAATNLARSLDSRPLTARHSPFRLRGRRVDPSTLTDLMTAVLCLLSWVAAA